jgi:hypothetical protein
MTVRRRQVVRDKDLDPERPWRVPYITGITIAVGGAPAYPR